MLRSKAETIDISTITSSPLLRSRTQAQFSALDPKVLMPLDYYVYFYSKVTGCIFVGLRGSLDMQTCWVAHIVGCQKKSTFKTNI